MVKRQRKEDTFVVSVRYTKDELALIDKARRGLKLTRSEYVRLKTVHGR